MRLLPICSAGLLALASACRSAEAPLTYTGPLTGAWVYHGADSSRDYFNLVLTQARSTVGGFYELCRPTVCGVGYLSAPYQDSSFTFEFGFLSFSASGDTATSSFTARLQAVDTVVGVLRNFAQMGSETFVFVRTNVVIPEPILPGPPPNQAPAAAGRAGDGSLGGLN
jgi:hypothetical protein